jgi:hypothetical protein
MNKQELMALRPYWSGWRLRTPSQKDDIFDTWSFYDLTHKMRARARYRFAKEIYEGRNVDCEWHGSDMASKLASTAAPFWSDFQDIFPHHFMKYHYEKLPKEHHDTAKNIVEVLNKMKGGAWVYALCLVNFPDYEKYHMREKIIKEMKMTAEVYDSTANLMREILQQDKYR